MKIQKKFFFFSWGGGGGGGCIRLRGQGGCELRSKIVVENQKKKF